MGYQATHLSVAEVEEEFFEADVKKREAISTAANSGEKTVAAAKAKVHEDPDYVEAKQHHLEAYAHVKILRAVMESTERKNTLVSRELTRRVGRDPREGRNNRWGGA